MRELDVARLMGATETVNVSNVDPVAAVLELTGDAVLPYIPVGNFWRPLACRTVVSG